jgi:hypothetical protein
MTPLRQGSGAPAACLDCPHEQQVVNAVLAGAWPDRADDNLVSHASTCEVCREVASVAVLLREDLDSSRIEVVVPAAGQVWWRAAVRARLESTQAAAKPMSWMYAITGAIVLGAFLAAITAVWPMLPGALDTVRGVSLEIFPSRDVASAIAGSLATSAVVGLIAAGLLVLAPLAVYFVLSDD